MVGVNECVQRQLFGRERVALVHCGDEMCIKQALLSYMAVVLDRCWRDADIDFRIQ